MIVDTLGRRAVQRFSPTSALMIGGLFSVLWAGCLVDKDNRCGEHQVYVGMDVCVSFFFPTGRRMPWGSVIIPRRWTTRTTIER